MSLRVKQRILFGALVLFALWPLVQRQIVLRYGVDPWLFHGWAMYSVPRFDPEVRLYRIERGEAVELSPDILPEVALEYRRFVHQRRIYGRLADPLVLASRLLAAVPEADGVRVLVRTRSLDAGRGQVQIREDDYELQRRGSG